jgi:uncharacterized protein YigA (DUF484 family)
MKATPDALEHASVQQYCKALRVPVIAANFVPLAEQAVKENRNHIGYLEALLAMESEERDRHAVQNRLHALSDGSVRSGMPTETASALHHSGQPGERAGGSPATECGASSAGTLDAVRGHRPG